jgi:LmbE family N-acetylglucosaminyl deacetylase
MTTAGPGVIGLGAASTLLLVVAGARLAAASEAAGAAQPWPQHVVRPHLDAPAVPQPRQIRVPNTAAAQLLWSNKEIQVSAPIRMMVFTPHPDDETLAAAGLIQRVLANKGQVRVVFVTNGDGYVDAVRREVRRSRTSKADFIEYGERRHREAVQALRTLGLDLRDGIFLGFPDDGIDDLWAGHWSTRKPYTSPYTRFNHPFYKESLSHRVEYAGTDLESEIAGILREFSPDWVLVPDPRDRHPDHCTTGVFVLDALRKLRRSGAQPFAHVQVLTFLVHYPDYPASPAWIREIAGAGVGGSPTAGRVLSGAQWVHLQLTPAELAIKRQALSAYQSQIQVMDSFLRQFMLPFELFGELDATQIRVVPHEYAARFRRR